MTGAPIQRANTGHRIGESHPRSKLTDEKVREIRAHRKEGKGYKRIAKLTGIPLQTVRDVLSYRTWRHVIDAPDGSRGTVAP